jgi:xylose isomerase
MMKQLGLKSLRPGPNPSDQSTFDEAIANPYQGSMPDLLTLENGSKVVSAKQWPQRRRELVELFEREVYGQIPKNVPRVRWEVTGLTPTVISGIPTITKTLIGHVDNRIDPAVKVDIQASFTVPAHATANVPIMIEFGFSFATPSKGKPWTEQAIEPGWGYGTIVPTSIQPDNNHLEMGIIGLCNRGKPRKPDDWGALRAWGWGLSRLIDYFEQDKSSKIDPSKVGIEGVSRYGKAALVAEAFDPRVAVGFIGSSGEGGAKLYRHIFGEAVENLAGGEFYWMAGNFMKYGASDPPKTAADLPVDSHELIALCAPRPCFISYGLVEHGDAKWVDAHGSFMAGVLAGPAYRLLGKRDFGTPGNYLNDPMPPVNQLIGGELAWRQHDGGHEVTPNWPAFFDWVARYIQVPPLPTDLTPVTVSPDTPIARTDSNSAIAHFQLLQKAAKGGIDVYFEGDSITRRWGTSDDAWKEMLANWRGNFYGWNAADFGWGADTCQNILWRLRNGELEGVNPKVIVLLAGTNNIGAGEDADRVAEGVEAVVNTCRSKAPKAAIILTAILPRNDNMSYLPTIQMANDRLKKFAVRNHVRFINVNSGLVGADGRLFEGMTIDNLHPSVKGYQVWADALKPILTELLGPPAPVDHAPPQPEILAKPHLPEESEISSTATQPETVKTMSYFPEVSAPIRYEGPKSKNPLAFKRYDAQKKVGGKSMAEHLRFAVCYWHTFKAAGSDPFGSATMRRPWETPDETMDAAFEFFTKLGVGFWCFHDRDIAPEMDNYDESAKELSRVVKYAKKKQEESGVKLLWGTANLFSHPRYQAGAATNPDPHVFAYAAAQVRRALDATQELGGLGYTFWGGREGYDTLLNTDLRREREQFAKFLWMAVDYAKEIGFKGQFYIEPKPKEPTTHQYDSEAAVCLNFLREFDLLPHLKLNLETNHATLAGHTMRHEMRVAREAGALGSVDANRGDELIGWDTDQFPTDLYLTTEIMLEILAMGGFTTGGLNFDAKVRRQSHEATDLFYAHIGGMDAFAAGLEIAHAIIEDGRIDQMLKDRYAVWDKADFKSLKDCEDYVYEHGEPERTSGRQELLENIFNEFLGPA